MWAHGTVRPVWRWIALPDEWVTAPDGSQVRVLLRAAVTTPPWPGDGEAVTADAYW
jgi:hypothetical protein